jgi:CRISPR/Cas system CSM-associated protein Csm3 (group 7 of RAMP superfamily)
VVAVKVIITFHGPFRVATGVPVEGLNVPVDREDLLPASSLKGVMRAAALQVLPGRIDLVEEVFGHRADASGPGVDGADDAQARNPAGHGHGPSPWHWSSADFGGTALIRPRARIAIDAASGTARKDHLMLGEEVWARTADFHITQRVPLTPDTLRRHQVILACAAAAVHALGADRRRGHGWVTFTPEDPRLDDTVFDELWSLRG